jgi:hypothetical protein
LSDLTNKIEYPAKQDLSGSRKGVAMGAVKALTDDGLFIGQKEPRFFDLLNDLAEDVDKARRDS